MEGVTITPQSYLDEVKATLVEVRNNLTRINASQEERYLSISEACKMTGYSDKWFRLNKEKIGFCRPGDGDIRFKRSDLIAFMEANYFKVQTKLARKRRAS